MSIIHYYVISIILIFIIGITSSITDFKYGKIYNKYLKIIIIIGIANISFFYFFGSYNLNLKPYLINLFIAFFISYLLYYLGIWAAGDGKLFFTFLLLIPYDFYNVKTNIVFFPGVMILFFSFTSAFFYFGFETIILLLRDIYNKKNKFVFKKIEKTNVKSIAKLIIKFILIYIFSVVIDQFIFNKFNFFYKYNQNSILLLRLLLIFLLTSLDNNKINLLIAVFTFIYLFNVEIRSQLLMVFNNSINLKLFLIIIIFMLLKYLGSKYNYKKIKLENLRKGMILSKNTVLLFQLLNLDFSIKHLLEKQVLTVKEVEIVKNRAYENKKMHEIQIVRKVPFAPFIFGGVIIFFII